ncbi:MAG: hypothetical protein WA294_14085 [Acidobacteriaceae bacterium]
MNTAPPVPMIAPDGSFHWIPNADVDAAVRKGGGKAAVRIADPKGVQRWIPHDVAAEALRAGGKLVPLSDYPKPPAPSAFNRFVSSAVAPIKGAVKSFSGNPTPEEAKAGLTTPYDTAMRPFERAVEAQTGQVDEANDLRKQGRYSEAGAHYIASAVPLLGPWVADATQEYYDQLGKGDTAGAVGTAAGNAAMAFAPEAAGKIKELAPRAASAAGDLAMRPVRAVTGAGPRAVRGLVKDTADANATAAAKAAEQTATDRATVDKANAKLSTDRQADVRSHFDKTQAAKTAAEQRAGVASRKSALETGVRTLSDKFQGDLKAVREKAAGEADAKYQALNAALGEMPANGEFLPNALVEASEKIRGSETEPTIFRDIEKKIQRGDGFTYTDLQGYYSELGRELKRGTLPGDVYTAYNSLQDSIGDEMQRIADTQGLGPQLTDARTTWRNLKQTFYDPKSPLRKALDAKEAGGAIKVLSGKDRTGIEALAKYDPQLAQRANTIRGYQEEANGTRLPSASTKPAPRLAPRTEPAPYPAAKIPEVKKLGPRAIQEAKAEILQKGADRVRSIGRRAAMYGFVDAPVEIALGAAKGIPALEIIGALRVPGALITSEVAAQILESPKVVSFLTEATPRDVAAIPADLRGDFPQIVRRAQAQGIKVSPALTLAFRGAAALAPRRQEQNPTDAWSSGQQ